MQDARRDDPRGIMELTETRRGLLRRSLLGLTGFGVAGVLVACGDDDDDDDDDSEEPIVTGQEGAEDPGEDPGIGEETGIGEGAAEEAEGEEPEDEGD
jgi:hypothetical protein